MKHFVVTVGCEYGSGGIEIGKMVAKSLGVEYYDRDLIDKVVEEIGVDRDLVKKGIRARQSSMNLIQALDRDMQTLQTGLFISSLRLSINLQRNLPVSS